MELEQANEVLKLLADGFDPMTGVQLPPDHILHRRDVVAALNMASAYFELTTTTKGGKKITPANQPANHGAPWTDKDREYVRMKYAEGMTMTEIGKTLERSRGSIWAQLKQLGVVGQDESIPLEGNSSTND